MIVSVAAARAGPLLCGLLALSDMRFDKNQIDKKTKKDACFDEPIGCE
jgi:hypothetical protein